LWWRWWWSVTLWVTLMRLWCWKEDYGKMGEGSMKPKLTIVSILKCKSLNLLFLATHWRPNIFIWLFLLIIIRLLAVETSKITSFFFLNFTFWQKIFSKWNADSCQYHIDDSKIWLIKKVFNFFNVCTVWKRNEVA
jgi:hypothetical protein